MLECNGAKGCNCKVTHIDNKGFIYCTEHGKDRQAWRACRKMKNWEIRLLEAGKCIRWELWTREQTIAKNPEYASIIGASR